MCQSFAMPSTAEYWQSGGTTARFGMVRPRSVSGENSSEPMPGFLLDGCCRAEWNARARQAIPPAHD